MSLAVILNVVLSTAVIVAIVGSLAWSVAVQNGIRLASPTRAGRRARRTHPALGDLLTVEA